MKQSSTITKLRLRFSVAAVILGAVLTFVSLSETANAAPRQSQGYYEITPGWVNQNGPYRNHLLPNGTLTGPIAVDANGGG
jgi:hypothetical protein